MKHLVVFWATIIALLAACFALDWWLGRDHFPRIDLVIPAVPK